MPADVKEELPPFTAYQKRLFVFLSVATFFEGFDSIALTQLLPNLRADFGLDEAGGGWLIAFINVGTIIAYLFVRQADRWGRRRVLEITIAGYTIASFLTGLAPNVWVFGVCQLIGRVFLIAEWATSMVYAAEEYPASRRGHVIGLISAFAALGSVACAGLVPLFLKTPLGWRSVYFAGTLPLIMLAFARRSLKDTQRFTEISKEKKERASFFRIFSGPYRARMFQLAVIWGLTYACTATAMTFWKEFAVAERGLSDGEVGFTITVAALAAMPLVFLSGKLLDVIGRRGGAAVIYLATTVAVVGAYTAHNRWILTLSVVGCIFGISGVLPVLNAFTTELFPTELRGDAFAWSNNLLGRITYVAAPILVGFLAGDLGWGTTLSFTAATLPVGLALIFLFLPETRGRELEETASLTPAKAEGPTEFH